MLDDQIHTVTSTITVSRVTNESQLSTYTDKVTHTHAKVTSKAEILITISAKNFR